ncbi:ABC transporter permease [bacterium]|nr:ABC transporter permease [bacterium]
MNPVFVIARHEFRTLVGKPAFLLTFVLGTVFVLGFSIIVGGLGLGGDDMAMFGAGMFVGTMFFMITMSSTTHLLQVVLEEKLSRVVEILLSKVSSEELLWGKVLGMGAVAGAQVLSWLVLGGIAALVGANLVGNPEFAYDPGRILLMLLFGAAGFLMFAALIAAGGSLANDMKEAQSMTMLVMFSVMIPWQLGFAFSMNVGSNVQRVMSIVPLTAPMAMIIRLGQGPVPPWEVAISLALLVGLAWLSLRLGATAFDLGLLSAGRRLTWKTVAQTYMARRRR